MGSNSDRCAGLEIRDGVQCPCLAKRVTLLRYRRPGPDMMGIVFQIYLCPEHGEQFSKWGWKCVDTQLRTEDVKMTQQDKELMAAIEWLDIVAAEAIQGSEASVNASRAGTALRRFVRQEAQSKEKTTSLEQIPHLHAYVAKLDPDNIAQFSSRPMAHDNIGLAVREAERLAKKEPGHKFAVFTALGYYEVPKPGAIWTGVTTRS